MNHSPELRTPRGVTCIQPCSLKPPMVGYVMGFRLREDGIWYPVDEFKRRGLVTEYRAGGRVPLYDFNAWCRKPGEA